MSREQSIVFVGHDATRTGAPTSLLRIVEWFAGHTPHPCAVILNNGGALEPEYAKYASVDVWNQPYRVPWDPRRLVNEGLRRLGHVDKQLLSRHQASIVRRLAARSVGAIFSNTGLNGHILASLKSAIDAPVVSRIPELEAYMRKNNVDGSVDRVLALSDHFVAVSQAVKDNLVRRHAVAQERITVIHGACAATRLPRGAGRLRDKLGIPENAFVVGGCGTLDWRKGIDLFIQVANGVAKRPDCVGIYFCWIGAFVSKSSAIELRHEIELHALEGRLFFLGEVADTAPYLADLDLFLLTSREDPFPLVMLEAARQGVPVVCFEGSGGAAEFIDSTAGVTVPMLDVAAMAQVVADLKDAPERRAALASGAHHKSLAFTTERMGQATYAVLQSAMSVGQA